MTDYRKLHDAQSIAWEWGQGVTDAETAIRKLHKLFPIDAALAEKVEPIGEVVIGPKGDVEGWTVVQWLTKTPPVGTKLYTAPQSGVREGMPANRTDYVSRAMVDAFLNWRLPEDFSPDAGISFTRDYNQNTPYPMKHEPIGTNLFSADQAREMLEYVMKESRRHQAREMLEYVMKESRRLEGERATRAAEGMAKAFEGLGAGRAITRAADQVNAEGQS